MIHFQSTSHTSTMFTIPFVFASHLLVIQSTASFIARLRMSGVSANKWCSPCNLYEQIVYIKICTNYYQWASQTSTKINITSWKMIKDLSLQCLADLWSIRLPSIEQSLSFSACRHKNGVVIRDKPRLTSFMIRSKINCDIWYYKFRDLFV